MKKTIHLGRSSEKILGNLGGGLLDFLIYLGQFGTFAFWSFERAITPPWRWSLLMDQCLKIGVKSFPVAALTSVFVSMVTVLQTGVQLSKFGSKTYVPGISWVANAREMVPAFCGMVVGARVAASITAEIGTMRVTEQIEAMDILNVDPYRYLVAPRLIAMTFMLPLICGVCLVTGYFGGMSVAQAGLNIDPYSYYNITLKFAYLGDVVGGLTKTIFFGMIIGVTGCFYGFNTYGGAQGVGRSTTSSVVTTLVLILIFDYILTSLILTITQSV